MNYFSFFFLYKIGTEKGRYQASQALARIGITVSIILA